MKRLLILTLGAALAGGACGTTASDAADTPLPSERAAGASTTQTAPGYREMTIPTGTTLPLALTSSVASDTSAVEDSVTAELTSPITIDGRDVLPAGTRLAGVVTGVDDSDRVKGRAMIAFRFTSLRTGDARYDLQAAPLSRLAEATKGEDATKIGIGAGAGAVIGGSSAARRAQGKARSWAAAPEPVSCSRRRDEKCGSGLAPTSRLVSPRR